MPKQEICVGCGDPTGRAGKGEDSIYCDPCDIGPFCEGCIEQHDIHHHGGNDQVEGTPGEGQTEIPGTEEKPEPQMGPAPDPKPPIPVPMNVECPECLGHKQVVYDPKDPENAEDCRLCKAGGEFNGLAAVKVVLHQLCTTAEHSSGCASQQTREKPGDPPKEECDCGLAWATKNAVHLMKSMCIEPTRAGAWEYHDPDSIMEFHLYEIERKRQMIHRSFATQGAIGALHALESLGAFNHAQSEKWRDQLQNAKMPPKGACTECGGKGVLNHPLNASVCSACEGDGKKTGRRS